MRSQEESPHWDSIVGENWPVIDPTEWQGLETSVREAASAVHDGDVERARRAFDAAVLASAALQPIKQAMAAHVDDAGTLAAALLEAAAVYALFANLAYSTRNRILDIVDDALRRIGAVEREAAQRPEPAEPQPGVYEPDPEDHADDKHDSNADTRNAAIEAIIAEASANVAEVAAAAVTSVDGLVRNHLRAIGEILGRLPAENPIGLRLGAVPGAPLPGIIGETPTPWNAVGAGIETGAADAGNAPEPSVGDGAESPVGVEETRLPVVSGAAGDGISSAPGGGGATPPEGVVGTQQGGDVADSAGRDHDVGGASTISQDSTATQSNPALEDVKDSPVSAADPDAALINTGRSPESDQMTVTGAAGPGEERTTVVQPAGMMPMVAGPTGATGAASAPSSSVSATNRSDEVPRGATRFAATAAKSEPSTGTDRVQEAVGAAMAAAESPSFVVDNEVNGDLVLARTLLGAILAAAGMPSGMRQSAVTVGWAVSVMRGPAGMHAFITSNEGRGWIPSGLYLPREITVPWTLDSTLGGIGAAWEGVADPARILVEFARVWADRSGSRITAVASSAEVDDRLRGVLGDAGVSAGVVAAETGLDLCTAMDGFVDRLSATGLGATVPRIPESEGWARCLQLAAETHAHTVPVAGADLAQQVGEIAMARELRNRILGALRAGAEVPAQWWEDLWGADVLLEATLMFRRIDVSMVDVGDIRVDPVDGAALRGLVFERRCNEQVLLLGQGWSEQLLREIAYGHDQVVRHPLFPEAMREANAAQRALPRITVAAPPDAR